MHFRVFLLVIGLGMLLGACDAVKRSPSGAYVAGEIIYEEDFEVGVGWDTLDTQGVLVEVRGGRYWMRSPYNSYVRGFNSERHENVVIEVVTSQSSGEDTNAYGVVCRGGLGARVSSGYYFLIGADGSYSIRVGRAGEVEPLVAWARSSVINKGIADNIIRAVCVDDYLALYVNNQFIADTHDSRYESGYAGFAVATRTDTLIDVSFDNLTIWDATQVND